MTTLNLSNMPQTQENIEKYFYQQLQPGDYIDARYSQKEWKLAKVMDKENRYLTIMFDGYQATQQIYMHSFKINCLRSQTVGYTGPIKGHHSSFISIPQLNNHIKTLDSIINSEEPPSAYKITQYLRGQLFVGINSLLLSDIDFSEEETTQIYKFLMRFLEKVMKICNFAKQNIAQYFELQSGNKLLYLANYKLAIISSLQELLYLVCFIISADTPKLLKIYKTSIPQENLFAHTKQYIQSLINIFHINDGNGKWMPTEIRIQAIRILIRFKKQDQLLFSIYDIKDYQEFHSFWPWVLKYHPSIQYEEAYINFMIKTLINPTPFDAKLKALQVLRRIMEKQMKFTFLSPQKIVQQINKKKVLETLLNQVTFNPQIMKRYVPIIQSLYTNYNMKKYLTNTHIDSLFYLMNHRHESEVNVIQQIIVNLAEFISLDHLDYIFNKIQSQININTQQGIKFIREFSIKAVKNHSSNSNRGFIGALLGRKKCSSKYGFYGLNLLWKEIHDNSGKIKKPAIQQSINSIGLLFQNQCFASERNEYILSCINCMENKNSFGQCLRILKEIIKSYPVSAIIGDSQVSILDKFDQKYRLLDIMISGLVGNQKVKEHLLKIPFQQSLKYFYEFLQEFQQNLKFPLKIQHIQYLWKYPHIFDYLRKVREIETHVPGWKKKYFKKINPDLMKDILLKLVVYEKNMFLNSAFFDTIDQLFMAYHYNAKNIDITERSTIRYKVIKGLAGLEFYYKFIEKLLKQKIQDRQLFKKVCTRIIDIHLRPVNHEEIEQKCQIWLYGMLNLMKLLKSYPTNCLYAVETFLEEIKGKNFKEISATGSTDIVVSYNGMQKTVNVPRNATIFKLRKNLMSTFSIKWNFILYNAEMKRQITYAEQEDFSVNAMSYKVKGPSLYIRRVEQGIEHPHLRAKERFMSIIENQNEFYSIIFGLLAKVDELPDRKQVEHKIWKLIQNLPTNKAIIQKIQNCSEFNSKGWQQFLKAENEDYLQYSLKIIYELMGSVEWTYDLQKTKGLAVLQTLYIKMLTNKTDINEKSLCQLSKINLKAQEVIKVDDLEKQNASQILKRLMKFIQFIFEHEKISYHIQTINLLLKEVIVSWKKLALLTEEELITYLKQDNLLIKIGQFGLFLPKEPDTSFFVEDILQVFFLNVLSSNDKKQLFAELVDKYLDLGYLLKRQSSENYFIFIIDIINSLNVGEEELVLNSSLSQKIEQYVNSVIFANESLKEVLNLDSELVYGAFKLLSLLYRENEKIKNSQKWIFENLLEKFVFEETRIQNQKMKKTLRNKNKKILYDIVKKMIFSSEELLQVFVSRLEQPLAKGNWRKNTYFSWSLEQPKNDKKYFCGLENLAATCYMNCLFQQIFMIKRFRDQFIDVNSLAYRQTYEENQVFQLQKILAYLKYGNKKSYTTRPFCQSFITYQGLPIDPTVQSDADEFFNALMQKIQTFLKATNRHYILQDTFEGKLSNQLNCEGCPHNSEKVDSFSSIGLNIKNKKNLEEALNGYVQGEILDGDNAYFCEICEKKVRTMKRLCIKELPNILVIVLKRFTYNFDEMRKIKINDELKYPQEINMKNYTSQYLNNQEVKELEEYDYKLRGVVIHSGTSQGGHYYSFINQQEKWYQFNDETIEQAEFSRIEEEGFGGQEKDTEFKLQKHKNAYILFYEKKKQHFSAQKHQISEQESFDKQLNEIVTTDNKNADFLAILLDHLFVRLCENVSMSEFMNAKKFILLYFHSVLLRDRHHEDYLSNIYRLILVLMDNKQLSQWYISQINHYYVKQFFIQSPRKIRYLCIGLILKALKVAGVEQIDRFLQCMLFCLNKKGMTPFAKIFIYLSKFSEVREKLIKYEFPDRILNILLNKKIPTQSIIYEEKSSYFGKDSSQKEKQVEFCHICLVQCLKYYEITDEDAFKIMEQYNSRVSYKNMSQIIARNCQSSENAQKTIKMLQTKALNEKSKKEDVDQYLMMVRYMFLQADRHPDFSDDLKQMCLFSLRTMIKESDCNYMIMELTLIEMNKIANISEEFKKLWKTRVLKDQKLRKAIQYWIRQSDRPHFMSRSEEWKRKVLNLTYNQRQILINENKLHQENRTAWMLNEALSLSPQIYSDLDETEEGKQMIVGFKSYRVMEHLGALTKVEAEKQTKWAIMDKNQVDLYSWL